MTASDTPDARERVLRAALEIWAEDGPAKAKITAIGARAGVSTGSLYHHFRDREDVLATLFLEGLASYQGGLLSALTAAPSARAGVYAIVGWHLRWVTANAAWARYLLSGAPSASDDFRAARTAANSTFFSALRAWAQPHLASGALRPLPLDRLAALVLGPVEAYSRQLLAGRRVRFEEDAHQLFAAAAWLTVSGAEGAAPTGDPA